jgi:hypothetical protein
MPVGETCFLCNQYSKWFTKFCGCIVETAVNFLNDIIKILQFAFIENNLERCAIKLLLYWKVDQWGRLRQRRFLEPKGDTSDSQSIVTTVIPALGHTYLIPQHKKWHQNHQLWSNWETCKGRRIEESNVEWKEQFIRNNYKPVTLRNCHHD